MGFDYNKSTNGYFIAKSIINIVTIIVSFIAGCIILYKGIRCIKFTKGFAGLLLFGALTYSIGFLILYFQRYETGTPLYIILGFRIGFAIIFSILSYYFELMGNISLGAICGWNLWSLFSFAVLNHIINCIILFVFAIIGVVLVFRFKEKGQIIASLWFGSYSIMTSIKYAITMLIPLSGNWDVVIASNLPISIVTIILTFLIFGILCYRHHKISIQKEECKVDF